MNRRSNMAGAIVIQRIAMAVVLTACNAQVKEFSVVPRHICMGEKVELQWDVVGSASVIVTPPNADLPNGTLPSSGHATISPSTKTFVALHVTHMLGQPTTSIQEIEVRAPSEKPEILVASMGDVKARPGCGGGKVWATVHAERFAGDVKVATVAAHQGDVRIYEVDHAGLHSTVAPGIMTTAFAGTAISGDWVLTVPLSNGQTCATIPHNLVVDVTTKCLRSTNDSR
jgi:hypothetical protein